MNTQKILVVAGLVVILALGMTFPKGNTVVERITQLGAVSGPDINSPYINVNGVTTWFNRQAMSQGTTTVCSLKSPAVDSQLVSATANFTVSSTTASNVVIATSTLPYASTTLLAQRAIAANGVGTVVSTTTTASFLDGKIAANTYINVTMTGGVGTFSPTGTCNAVFRQL